MKVQRDSLYLFLCHVEWRNTRNLDAYKDLLAALDDHDPDIRQLAESLLRRSSPRPAPKAHQFTHEKTVAAAVGGHVLEEHEPLVTNGNGGSRHFNPHEGQSASQGSRRDGVT